MEKSELKRRVEDLGLRVEFKDFGKSVIYDSNYTHIATIDEKYAFQLDTMFRLSAILKSVDNQDWKKLFDILVEYARTPIHERKDEKRYSIYPIRTMDYRLARYDAIFRACGYEDEDSFDIVYPLLDKGRTTEFPESEAKEICDYFGWDFSKVAVGVEDEA